MRVPALLCLPLMLTGCGLMMPSPDPNQAWVELVSDDLEAAEVDQLPLDDGRYFQVMPGKHELGMRYAFEVSARNVGADAEPLRRECRLSLHYDDFTAGERYRLVTGQYGFRPWARLYDERNRILATGEERGCGRSDVAVR
ncbi:PA0061/PA0062 family lipoprotein [Pseudomonas sp. Marseille-QA0892]